MGKNAQPRRLGTNLALGIYRKGFSGLCFPGAFGHFGQVEKKDRLAELIDLAGSVSSLWNRWVASGGRPPIFCALSREGWRDQSEKPGP